MWIVNLIMNTRTVQTLESIPFFLSNFHPFGPSALFCIRENRNLTAHDDFDVFSTFMNIVTFWLCFAVLLLSPICLPKSLDSNRPCKWMIFAVIHVKSFVRMATLVLASTVSIPNL
jgi:hypothetical protein